MRSATEPMGIEAPGQPQHKRERASCSTKFVLGLIVVGAIFGVFLAIRFVQGCNCPAAFESNDHSTQSSSCACNGNVFSCKYTCGTPEGDVLYCGQELCPEQPSNTSSASGGGGGPQGSNPAGTVLCPENSAYVGEYCDCVSSGDCVNNPTTRCNCAEAKAASCCNSGSG